MFFSPEGVGINEIMVYAYCLLMVQSFHSQFPIPNSRHSEVVMTALDGKTW